MCFCCTAEQWLQFDIGPPTLVTGVVTKGRGDGRKKHWVTEYRLSYSNDSRLWHFYKDEPLQEIKARLLLLLLLTHSSTQPAYLHSLLNYHTHTRSLRSANTNLLSVPRVCTTFASCGFSVAAPTVWNSLPSDIRDSSSTHTFRRLLKTHCFISSRFSAPPSCSPKCLGFGLWLTLCTLNTDLLTYLLLLLLYHLVTECYTERQRLWPNQQRQSIMCQIDALHPRACTHLYR